VARPALSASRSVDVIDLLATFPVGRVEASTDRENIPEQRALERAGFAREGVARSAAWRSGRWHDMVVYSRVHGDR